MIVSRRTAAWALALLAAAYLAFSLVTLDRVPLMYGDEPWYMEPAVSFAETGHFSSGMFSGLAGLERTNVAYGHIHLALHAASFRLFGPGLLQARIVDLLAGLVVVWLVYLAGRRLFNRWTGLLAAGVLLFSYPFFVQSHMARAEMLLLAFVLGGLVLVLRAQDSGRTWLYFAAGLLGGLAADVHLMGIPFLALVPVLVAARSGWRALVSPVALVWAGGVVVGGGWWVGTHVLPDPGFFAYQWSAAWSTNQVAGFSQTAFGQFVHPMSLLKAEVQRYVHPWQHGPIGSAVGVFMLAVAAASGAALLPKEDRRDGDRVALALLVAAPAVLLLAAANKTAVYAFVPMPFVSIVIARAVDRWRVASAGRGWAFALAGFVAVQLVASGALAATNPDHDPYTQAAHAAEAYIEPGEVVMGDPVFWFGLRDHPYASQWGQYLAGSLPEWVEMRHVHYAILDADDSPENPQGMYYSIRDRMHLVTEIRVGAHHAVRARLYEIDEEPHS